MTVAARLVAASLAVFHLLDPSWSQRVLGVLLILSSLAAAVSGWWRYRQADRAIRAGEPLPASSGVNVLTLGVLAVILVVGLSVVL